MIRRAEIIVTILGLMIIGIISLIGSQQSATMTTIITVQPLMAPTEIAWPAGEPTLKGYATARNLLVGAAVDVEALLNEADYRDTLIREYSLVAPENAFKLRELSAEPGIYNFGQADAFMDFAIANGMRVRGMPLIWHKGLPKWLTDITLPRDEALKLLERHIQTLAGRYRGQIYAWDVINEGLDSDGKGLRQDSVWMQSIGEDYVPMAFRIAREADPDAALFFADYGAEALGPKSDAQYALMKNLLANGVPVDGVAMQMHLRLDDLPNMDDVAANISRLNDLGLQVHISELDVRIQDIDAPMEERLAQQAEVYQKVFEICLAAKNCTSITTWGFTDRHSWIPGYTGNSDAPLPFDAELKPKPAYAAILDAIRPVMR